MAKSITQPEPIHLDANRVAAAIGGKAKGNKITAHAPGHKKGSPELDILIDPHAPRGMLVRCYSGEDPVEMKDWILRQCGEPDFTPGQKAEAPTAHVNLIKKRFSDFPLTSQGYTLAAEYDYAAPDGEVLFQVLRYEHPTKEKTFLQRRPDGRGGWLSGRGEPTLYKWHNLASRPSEPVYVVEGEKDADNLAAVGLLATTVPNGSWPEDLSPLKGRKIYVLADNDAAGEKKAAIALEKLQGIATVRRVELPGLPDKGDVSDWLAAGNAVEQLQALAKSAPLVAANQNERSRFTVDWFHEIEDSMPKETFIKGVFGVNEFTMLSGKPGSGKSAVVTDMACHVAAGMDWHGRRVKQGLVVYIAAERKDLTKRRMLAFRKRHDIEGATPLAVFGGRMDLTTGLKDAEDIAATIKQLELECGMPCVWIIVDTLTRVFGPGDQNASKDMSRFIQSCDTVREAVTGSHVLVIHHTGWAGDRGKGAIDLDGAVDASFLVKKEAGGYLLECDGTNDGDEGVITRFRMEGVQVGTDEDGEPTMAPVIIPMDGPADGLLRKIHGNAAVALEILKKLVEDGEPVAMATWRTECREAFDDGSGKSTDALNKQFDRAKLTLIDKGAVEQIGGGFLPTS